MKSVFFVLLILSVFIFPSSVEAGFFSFLDGFFGGESEVVTQNKFTNSQNIALLQAALNSDPNPSKGGGDITIVGGSALLPDSGPAGTMAQVAEEKSLSSDQISIYVVRDGDSLSQIAKMFGVSVNTIIWANDIRRGNLIKEGQTLVILPISGLQHTVKKGETLKSIAKKYKGDIQEIQNYNGFTDDNKLAIGEVLVIPNGEITTVKYKKGRSYKVRGTNVPAYKGYYIRPLNKWRKSQGLHGYNAVDLAAPIGTPILAAASGDVIISRSYGWNGGYGKYVVIKHPNGTQTLYAHLSKNIVKSGWHLVKGQVLGYVGSTGRSTGPHLHFEIRGAKNPF